MLNLSKEKFGSIDGQDISLYRLSNEAIDIMISNYGCTIVEVNMPDRNGVKRNIVAGYPNLEGYINDEIYAGAVVGRYANRIAFGKFSLDGKAYRLPVNNGNNHLHGGIKGFNKKVWKVEQEQCTGEKAWIKFSYVSADGEEGYPGELHVSVEMTLDNASQLSIKYSATTDKTTIVNLTNHSYFNLSGFTQPTILEHVLKMEASAYTIKDGNNIPTGQIVPVKGTPLDFTQFESIGSRISELKADKGYDHNFVLENNASVKKAATLSDPLSGRVLEVYTDRPGIQLYTANWWDGSITGRQQVPYVQYGAVALETQAYPDSPNHPDFPSVVLKPGEQYCTKTIFKFFVKPG